MNRSLIVGARASSLSQAQVQEVLAALQANHPDITFTPRLLHSRGDKELSISLRTLEKTDFFTAEIDALLLSGGCRIAIHSAKDLPEPLPAGLQIVALTEGVDSRDALVLRSGEQLDRLPSGAVIATSSERREEAVRTLRKDLRFIDIRGTIEQRLAKLQTGEADGVVIAEAALIRLQLTALNRVILPGSTVPFQGQLAILAREEDQEMEALFHCLDTRKRTLYLGLEPPMPPIDTHLTHYPIIKIVPTSPITPQVQNSFRELDAYTHLLFTSKSAVRLFCDYLPLFGYSVAQMAGKEIVAVGRATAACLKQHGLFTTRLAEDETAAGLVTALQKASLQNAYCFWPHSAISRPVVSHFLRVQQIRFQECILYNTKPNLVFPLPDLSLFNEIYFTSPSTVDAFLMAYGHFPTECSLTSIGTITGAHLHALRVKSVSKH